MTGVVGLLLVAGAALGVGVGSALLPLFNAEAYAVLVAVSSKPAAAVVLVLALAAGQTAGKLVLFGAARRGVQRRPPGPPSRWASRVARLLRSRCGGPVLVLASATTGVPPLAVVSLAAGAAGQRWWVFAALCLLGRVGRFAAIVLPLTVL